MRDCVSVRYRDKLYRDLWNIMYMCLHFVKEVYTRYHCKQQLNRKISGMHNLKRYTNTHWTQYTIKACNKNKWNSHLLSYIKYEYNIYWSSAVMLYCK